MFQVKSFRLPTSKRRSLQRTSRAMFATLALSLCVSPSIASTPEWYLGLSGGASRLTPDTDGSIYRLNEETSPNVGLFLGRDVTDRLSLELGYSRLGEAGLVGRADSSISETIAYDAISASALYYVFGDREDIAAREATATYLRLGLSSISNESDIDLDQQDNTSILAALGVERLMGGFLGGRWGLRAELATLDGDVQTATVSVYLRPFSAFLPARSSASRPAPAPTPVPEAVILPEVDLWDEPESAADDTGLQCPQPVSGEPADASGCAVFTGTIITEGFDPTGSELTPEGRQALDKLAVLMRQHPDAIIELQSHSSAFDGPETASRITRARVVNAARHLSARGVPVARLRARAFGNNQPLADRTAPDDRLELRILP